MLCYHKDAVTMLRNNVTKEARTIDGNFISKKDLLKKYPISYGALYRWKRMGLIPEEWFQKRSAATGQETFFPEREICERIELIMSQKDDISLSGLSEKLSTREKEKPKLVVETAYGKKAYDFSELRGVKIISPDGQETDITEEIIKKADKNILPDIPETKEEE